MEQTETYQDKWKAERKAVYKQNELNLGRIQSALIPTLDRLKLIVEWEQIDSETYQGAPRLHITDPKLSDFKFTISCAITHPNKQIASCWYKTERSVWTPAPDPRYEGDGNSERYEFHRFVTADELRALGMQTDCKWSSDGINSMSAEFSAVKNIKLILNHLVKPLEIYQAMVALISPRIDERIKKDNHILDLMKELARACGYPAPIKRSQEYSVNLVGGKVSVSEYGTIKLERELNEKEFHKLIKQHRDSETKGEY